MTKLSDTYKELGIDFIFPIVIRNANGNRTYYEDINGYWWKYKYDSKGNKTYSENSRGYWWKHKYDSKGNKTYSENSNGYWCKYEYDAKGNETYYEDSDGCKKGTPRSQSCAGKVIEVDGKKYKLMEL
jgi:hypothetical protein